MEANKIQFAKVDLPSSGPVYFIKDTSSQAGQYSKDIIKGEYEGGFTLWECTRDLLALLDTDFDFTNKTVLDIGCGHGLLGILALKKGAKHVTFQDYNLTVLQNLTATNIRRNCENFQEKISFLYGDWTQLQPWSNLQGPSALQSYDVILGCELIYDEQNYGKVCQVILKYLSGQGQAILGNKMYYFGVGGSMSSFKEKIETYPLAFNTVKNIVPKTGNKKQIISIVKKSS